MRPRVRKARKFCGLLFLYLGTAAFLWAGLGPPALRHSLGPNGVPSHGLAAALALASLHFLGFILVSFVFWWAGWRLLDGRSDG